MITTPFLDLQNPLGRGKHIIFAGQKKPAVSRAWPGLFVVQCRSKRNPSGTKACPSGWQMSNSKDEIWHLRSALWNSERRGGIAPPGSHLDPQNLMSFPRSVNDAGADSREASDRHSPDGCVRSRKNPRASLPWVLNLGYEEILRMIESSAEEKIDGLF
jgi:hypothetical protein